MKLLIKFPTRSRGRKFLDVLGKYIETAKNPDELMFLVTVDHDDETMDKNVVQQAMSMAENIQVTFGHSSNKVHACNRDLENYDQDWDIVMLASDDMIPKVKNWDQIIVDEMEREFPDTNGALWFYDGHQNRICTLSILGRKRYDQFGYIYHPSYVSLWCDNEFTEVAISDNSMRHYPMCLFKHEHPMWMNRPDLNDDLYRKNDSFFKSDQKNYKHRKKHGFKK